MEGSLSGLAAVLQLPDPNAEASRLLLYRSSLSPSPFDLWASMTSSGSPPLSFLLFLATSSLWSQCLAALQSWLTFAPLKVDLPQCAVGRDPHGFPNPCH